MRAKETVDGNRVVEDERKGEINVFFTAKRREKKKDGEERMGWNEGEWRECRGR